MSVFDGKWKFTTAIGTVIGQQLETKALCSDPYFPSTPLLSGPDRAGTRQGGPGRAMPPHVGSGRVGSVGPGRAGTRQGEPGRDGPCFPCVRSGWAESGWVGWAGPGRAELGRAGTRQARPGRVGPGHAGPHRVGSGRVRPSRVGWVGRAGLGWVGPGRAGLRWAGLDRLRERAGPGRLAGRFANCVRPQYKNISCQHARGNDPHPTPTTHIC